MEWNGIEWNEFKLENYQRTRFNIHANACIHHHAHIQMSYGYVYAQLFTNYKSIIIQTYVAINF